MNKLLTLLFSTIFFGAAELAAQESSSTKGFTEGSTSISVGIPGGGNPYAGGTAGIWMGMSENINLGLNFGLGLDTATDPVTFNLLLAPAMKYYILPGHEVSPFFIGQLNLGVTTAGNDAVDLGIMGGFGAEWFVTNVFSVAAHTGLGIDILRPNEVDPIRLGTLTSGISGQIYW